MELSFSKKAKLETLENLKYPKSNCCKENFVRGYFYDDVKRNDFTPIVVNPDIIKSTKFVKKLLNDLEIDGYVVNKESAANKQTSTIHVTEEESIEKLHKLSKRFLCDKCAVYFFQGLFVKNGFLSDPEKEYQLEFTIADEDMAARLLAMLYRKNFEFKISQRRNGFVVYTRNSETIEDFLATIGAQSTCLEIMSNKVVKDIRNRVNRIKNCETANTAKAAKATSEHIDAIKKLIEKNKFEFLTDDLQYIAKLKMEHQDLSLAELAAITDPPMTKSSLNRRLKKLCEMANQEEKND